MKLTGHCEWPVSKRIFLFLRKCSQQVEKLPKHRAGKIHLQTLSLKMAERPPVSPTKSKIFCATLGGNIMHESSLVNDFLGRKWLTLRHNLAIFHTIQHEQERAANSGKTRSAHWLHISAWRRGMVGQTISHYKILEKLGEGGMSSFGTKYNRLIPQAGGVVFTP